MKIRIGIIGLGRMGITHYSIINRHPNVEISSVAETSSMFRNIFSKYIKSAKTFDDYKKLMDIDKPDAILICTPPQFHFQVAKYAALKGIHVFAEKPFTLNYQHAKELAEVFEKNGLINMVGYVNRYNDVFAFTKSLINDNLIDKPIRFKSEMYSGTITKDDKGSGWRATHETGGGAVFEMASHAIDLVNFLIGKPDKVSGTAMDKVYSKNVEDIVSTTFKYNSEIIGLLNINWSDESYRKPTNKIEIFGKEGKILADQYSLKLFLKEANNKYNYRKGWNTIYITDIFKPVPFYVRGNEFTRQLFIFADTILNNNQSLVSCNFREASDTLDIIGQMFKDVKED